jgi:predicted nucleic-acid-binding Zn-ribbon protein
MLKTLVSLLPLDNDKVHMTCNLIKCENMLTSIIKKKLNILGDEASNIVKVHHNLLFTGLKWIF